MVQWRYKHWIIRSSICCENWRRRCSALAFGDKCYEPINSKRLATEGLNNGSACIVRLERESVAAKRMRDHDLTEERLCRPRRTLR
jgi:hypothetical protein